MSTGPNDDELQGASATRRRELATFLRSRRERITPGDAGIPPGVRRRTPGLRREEVAQLAGVGVTWYTWLEQGRDIHPSRQVLNAIADTLQLDHVEREHLIALAGAPEPPGETDSKAVTPPVRALLRKLEPYPALVRNARTDILAYNRAANWLLGELDDIPPHERNLLWLSFTNEDWLARLPDLEDNRPRTVAQFRAAMTDHLSEPSWNDLVNQLSAVSEEFRAAWNSHDVAPLLGTRKRCLHPAVGTLNFHYTYLGLGRRAEIQMTAYTPADDDTANKLVQLSNHELEG